MDSGFTRTQWIILASLGVAVVLVYVLAALMLSSSNPASQSIAIATFTRTLGFPATFTPTPTSTATPTFTPTLIPPTATTQPSPTSTATIIPSTATRAATRRPTATATPKPPIYKYKAVNQGCEHSGQTFIQGKVYDKSGQLINGAFVALSGGGPDGEIAVKIQAGDSGDGSFSFIVDAFGPATGQKRWIWIVEGTRRVSDAVEFSFNNYNANNPASCWRGWVDFVLQ